MSTILDFIFVDVFVRQYAELMGAAHLLKHTEDSYWATIGHLFEDEMDLLVAEEEMGAAFERSMRWHASRA